MLYCKSLVTSYYTLIYDIIICDCRNGDTQRQIKYFVPHRISINGMNVPPCVPQQLAGMMTLPARCSFRR